MNKTEAVAQFKQMYSTEIARCSKSDHPALRELWNNYTDSLCRMSQITMKQYETWTQPGFVSNPAKSYKEFQIHQNCGYGWEEVCSEDNMKEAKQRLKEYRKNQPEYPVKLVVRRVKIGA